jgi:hypothetical protein
MNNHQLFRFHTITEYHRAAGLPKPAHPLISLVHMEDLNRPLAEGPFSLIYDFYSISLKRMKNAKFKYGQQASDFDEGCAFLYVAWPGVWYGHRKGQRAAPAGRLDNPDPPGLFMEHLAG